MRLARKILSVTLLPVLSAACVRASGGTQNVVTTKTPSEADLLQQQFKVECADVNNCNPSVGLLVSRMSDTVVALCTAFLAAPDLMLTNRHCLPDSLQIAGANCSGKMSFRFPTSNSNSAVTVDCGKVVAVSPWSVTAESSALEQTDYAILKLINSPGRRALKFDPSGVADNENLTIIRMNPDVANRVGTISSLSCRAVQNTGTTTSYTSDLSPIIQVNNCPLVHGNSGSPALGTSGDVKAVMMQVVDDISALKQLGIADPKPFGRATSFACLSEASLGLVSSVNVACQEDLTEDGAKSRAQRLTNNLANSPQAQAVLIAAVKGFDQNAFKGFHWIPKKIPILDTDPQDQTIMKYVMEPDCVLPFQGVADSWMSPYKLPGSRQYKPSATLDATLANLKLVTAYDDDYHAGVVVNPTSVNVTFSFSPQKLATAGSDDFAIVLNPDEVALDKLHLTVCTP